MRATKIWHCHCGCGLTIEPGQDFIVREGAFFLPAHYEPTEEELAETHEIPEEIREAAEAAAVAYYGEQVSLF